MLCSLLCGVSRVHSRVCDSSSFARRLRPISNSLPHGARYFNRYAFIEIALYGKSYITSAKSTWRLFKDRGVDALINDSLCNSLWTFGSIAVGALSSAFAFIYVRKYPVIYGLGQRYKETV